MRVGGARYCFYRDDRKRSTAGQRIHTDHCINHVAVLSLSWPSTTTTLAHCDAAWGGRQPSHLTPSGVEVSVVETDLTSEAEVIGWTELTGFVAENGRFSADVQLPFQSAADQYYRIIGRLATGEIDDSSVGDVFGVYGQSNGHNLSSLKGVAPAASTGGSAHILDSPSAGNQSGPIGGAEASSLARCSPVAYPTSVIRRKWSTVMTR